MDKVDKAMTAWCTNEVSQCLKRGIRLTSTSQLVKLFGGRVTGKKEKAHAHNVGEPPLLSGGWLNLKETNKH